MNTHSTHPHRDRRTCFVHRCELQRDLTGVTYCRACRVEATQSIVRTPETARVLLDLESLEPARFN